MLTKSTLVVFVFLLLGGCRDGNQHGIQVQGYLLDRATRRPVPDAHVTLLCWYAAGWDKTDYVSVQVVPNSQGYFAATFAQGYKVVVAGVAPTYQVALQESSVPAQARLTVKLLLAKKEAGKHDALEALYDGDLKEYIVQTTGN